MAATQTLKCERHGEPTRLTCAQCDQPICPKCLVRTEVGLRCESCARPTVVTPPIRPARSRLPLVLGLAGLAVFALLAAVVAFGGSSDDDGEPALAPLGSWSDQPDLPGIRGTTTATVLDDGRLLVAGGGVGAIALPNAELFEPAVGRWSSTGSLGQARRGHQAVLLQDGRVLVVGGVFESTPLASAEIYDPRTGTWSPTAPSSGARLGHSLTVLDDGRVLLAGGTIAGDTGATTEIFDPPAGRWAPAAAMSSNRTDHTATLLTDGKVLIVGGVGGGEGGSPGPLASAELYDPAADAFVRSTSPSERRANHTASRLDDGSVLVSGGTGVGVGGDASLASVEVFDPRTGSWTPQAPMAAARTGHTAVVLSDGRVLAAAGELVSRGQRRSLETAEVFDPRTGAWRSAGRLHCPRSEHAAALLPDGGVLVAAGDAAFPGQAPIAQSCAELYRP